MEPLKRARTVLFTMGFVSLLTACSTRYVEPLSGSPSHHATGLNVQLVTELNPDGSDSKQKLICYSEWHETASGSTKRNRMGISCQSRVGLELFSTEVDSDGRYAISLGNRYLSPIAPDAVIEAVYVSYFYPIPEGASDAYSDRFQIEEIVYTPDGVKGKRALNGTDKKKQNSLQIKNKKRDQTLILSPLS